MLSKEKNENHINTANDQLLMNCKEYCTSFLTSPKAPLPIIVKSSKSSTQILCLLSLINSVSFLSKSLMRLICSSLGTSEEANFLSNTHRLQWRQNMLDLLKQKFCIKGLHHKKEFSARNIILKKVNIIPRKTETKRLITIQSLKHPEAIFYLIKASRLISETVCAI